MKTRHIAPRAFAATVAFLAASLLLPNGAAAQDTTSQRGVRIGLSYKLP